MADEGAPRVIAEFSNYDEMINGLRLRANELNVSGEQLDAYSGLPSKYAQKLLGLNQIRRLGAISLGPFLGALCVKGQFVEDKPHRGGQTTPRKSEFVRSVAVHGHLTTRFLRKIGKKGGENSRKYLGKRLVKQLARRAANARWHSLQSA
jgi:hypothetical protein